MNSLLSVQRKIYHEGLLTSGVLTVDKNGIASNADKSSRLSVAIAASIAEQLMAEARDKA